MTISRSEATMDMSRSAKDWNEADHPRAEAGAPGGIGGQFVPADNPSHGALSGDGVKPAESIDDLMRQAAEDGDYSVLAGREWTYEDYANWEYDLDSLYPDDLAELDVSVKRFLLEEHPENFAANWGGRISDIFTLSEWNDVVSSDGFDAGRFLGALKVYGIDSLKYDTPDFYRAVLDNASSLDFSNSEFVDVNPDGAPSMLDLATMDWSEIDTGGNQGGLFFTVNDGNRLYFAKTIDSDMALREQFGAKMAQMFGLPANDVFLYESAPLTRAGLLRDNYEHDTVMITDFIRGNSWGMPAPNGFDDESLVFSNMTQDDHIKVGLFDFLISNIDRHLGNIVFPGDGYKLIDHGFISFDTTEEDMGPGDSFNGRFPFPELFEDDDVPYSFQKQPYSLREYRIKNGWPADNFLDRVVDPKYFDWAIKHGKEMQKIAYSSYDTGSPNTYDLVTARLMTLEDIADNLDENYTWGDALETMWNDTHPSKYAWPFARKSASQKNEAKSPSFKGGPGSGNFGHAGRPGHIGGSAPRNASANGTDGETIYPSWEMTAKDRENDRWHPTTRIRLPDARITTLHSADEFVGSFDSIEAAVLFNEEGVPILAKIGGADYVWYTEAEARSFSNAVLTHNHPMNTGLSNQDLIMAFNYGMAEIRAVAKDKIFSLSIDPERREWVRKHYDDVSKIVIDAWDDEYYHLGDQVAADKITVQEGNNRFPDVATERFMRYINDGYYGDNLEHKFRGAFTYTVIDRNGAEKMFISAPYPYTETGGNWMSAGVFKGGQGSGNFGHAGRPGHIGGSAPRGADVDFVSRTIDTRDPNSIDEMSFRGAAHMEGDELVTFHVTDDPEQLSRNLDAGVDLASHGGVDDLGVGLYGSDSPSMWATRSRGKWDFLSKISDGDRSAIADSLANEIEKQKTNRYITPGEYERAMEGIRDFARMDATYGVRQLAGQPYNIRFWRRDWLSDAGVDVDPNPIHVVEIRAKGKFGVLDQYISGDEARRMQAADYDGALVTNSMSTIAQMVIWNADAITGYKIADPLKTWDESKHPRRPAGSRDGGQFVPKSEASPDALLDASGSARSYTDEDVLDALNLGKDIWYPVNLSASAFYHGDGIPRIEIPNNGGGSITIPIDRLRKIIMDVDHQLRDETIFSLTIGAFEDRLHLEWDLEPERWDMSKSPAFQVDADMLTNGDMHLNYLALRSIGKGAGLNIARALFTFARDIGMKTVRLEADITIGRYAWARAGFDFWDARRGNSAKFFDWMDAMANNMERNNDPSLRRYLDERYPKGKTLSPRHQFVAEHPLFKAPEMSIFGKGETTIPSKYIINPDVVGDVHAGKGYMLDAFGLNDWEAVADLKNLVDTPAKSVFGVVALDGGETPNDARPVLFVATAERTPPGATDAPHWADYMGTDNFPLLFDNGSPGKSAGWREEDHPRADAGAPGGIGGQFVSANAPGEAPAQQAHGNADDDWTNGYESVETYLSDRDNAYGVPIDKLVDVLSSYNLGDLDDAAIANVMSHPGWTPDNVQKMIKDYGFDSKVYGEIYRVLDRSTPDERTAMAAPLRAMFLAYNKDAFDLLDSERNSFFTWADDDVLKIIRSDWDQEGVIMDTFQLSQEFGLNYEGTYLTDYLREILPDGNMEHSFPGAPSRKDLLSGRWREIYTSGAQGSYYIVDAADGKKYFAKIGFTHLADRSYLGTQAGNILGMPVEQMAYDSGDTIGLDTFELATGMSADGMGDAQFFDDGTYSLRITPYIAGQNVTDTPEGADALPAGEHQRIGIFDYLLGNRDRHTGNVMIGVPTGSSADRAPYTLIDHDLIFTFPETHFPGEMFRGIADPPKSAWYYDGYVPPQNMPIDMDVINDFRKRLPAYQKWVNTTDFSIALNDGHVRAGLNASIAGLQRAIKLIDAGTLPHRDTRYEPGPNVANWGDLMAFLKADVDERWQAVRSSKSWDESAHPRYPAGTPEGGQFAPKDTPIQGALFDLPAADWTEAYEGQTPLWKLGGLSKAEAVSYYLHEYMDSGPPRELDKQTLDGIIKIIAGNDDIDEFYASLTDDDIVKMFSAVPDESIPGLFGKDFPEHVPYRVVKGWLGTANEQALKLYRDRIVDAFGDGTFPLAELKNMPDEIRLRFLRDPIPPVSDMPKLFNDNGLDILDTFSPRELKYALHLNRDSLSAFADGNQALAATIKAAPGPILRSEIAGVNWDKIDTMGNTGGVFLIGSNDEGETFFAKTMNWAGREDPTEEFQAMWFADAIGAHVPRTGVFRLRDVAGVFPSFMGNTGLSSGALVVSEWVDGEPGLVEGFGQDDLRANAGLFNTDPDFVRQLGEGFVLDYIIGNRDRHPGNVIVSPDGNSLTWIDHGRTGSGSWVALPIMNIGRHKMRDEDIDWADALHDKITAAAIQAEALGVINPPQRRNALGNVQDFENVGAFIDDHADPYYGPTWGDFLEKFGIADDSYNDTWWTVSEGERLSSDEGSGSWEPWKAQGARHGGFPRKKAVVPTRPVIVAGAPVMAVDRRRNGTYTDVGSDLVLDVAKAKVELSHMGLSEREQMVVLAAAVMNDEPLTPLNLLNMVSRYNFNIPR